MKRFKSFILSLGLLMLTAAFVNAQSSTKEINYEGLKVIFKKTPKEVATASLFIRGGVANIDTAQQGIEAMALSLALYGGTKKMNKDEFASVSDKLGTSFGSTAARDYSSVTMTCLKDNWQQSWEMFTDALMEPAMDEQEFMNRRQQMVAGAKQQDADPDSYLRKMATQQLFSGTDYAKYPNGTPSTLEKISLAAVKKYYSSLLGKKKCYLVVVGNIDETRLLNNIKNTLARLPEGSTPKTPSFKSVGKPGVKIQDRDMATNYILGSMNAPRYNTSEGPLFEFAISILYDRYFVELRTKRSLSYAPAAFYNRNTIQRPTANLYISTTDPKQSLQVMTDIINDIKKNGFTPKEVNDKRKEYLTDYYMTNEASSSQAGVLGFCEASGNWKLFDEINNSIDKVRVEDLDKVFKKYMGTINWAYLGRKAQVAEGDFKQLTAAPGNKLPVSKVKPTKKG
jgi:predicted Zn-dependent peptidase